MFNLLNLANAIPAPSRSDRREERHPTAASVTLSCPDLGIFPGVLIDLSAHGARLRTAALVVVHAPIILEIDAMPLLSGRIIWAEGRELGMCFDHRLRPAVLDHLLAKSGAQRA